MKINHLIYLCLGTVALLSCTVLRQPQKKETSREDMRKMLIEKGLSASMLYTEGLRNNVTFGDPQYSIDCFMGVLAFDSTHAPTLHEMANLLAQNTRQALPFAREAVLQDSTNQLYRSQWADLLVGIHEYDSAVMVYHSLLKLSPNNRLYYSKLALLYDQLQQPFAAIAILDSAENQLGIMEGISDFKRQLLIDAKLYDKALAEAHTIANNDPQDVDNQVVIAELYATMGKDSLAVEAYKEALKIDPESAGAIISLNNYYKNKGDFPNIMATARLIFDNNDLPLEVKVNYFNNAIKIPNLYRDQYFRFSDLASLLVVKYPTDFRATELYAKHLIAGGGSGLEEALKIYKAHVADSIPQESAFTQILNMEAYLQRPDSVTKYTNLALEQFPQEATFYIHKGSALAYFLKEHDKAEHTYQQALIYADSDSLRSAIYGMMGDNRQQTGDIKLSTRYYKRGIRYDTTNAVLYNNYSYLLSERGVQLALAERLANQAIRLAPNNPTYLDTQAWALYKMGRYEEAKKILQQAIALDNQATGEILLHYGDVLWALNDPFMAKFYWEKARKEGADSEMIDKRLKQSKQ